MSASDATNSLIPAPITVALAKGALLKDSVRLFAAAGLDFAAVLEPGNR
jgi:ATP phosphoribosyltransferase